jgi:transcriptional regulator with XRE-family HTH domain
VPSWSPSTCAGFPEVRGLSQGELARRAGLSRQTLSNVRAGEGNPATEVLFAAALALGVVAAAGRWCRVGGFGLFEHASGVRWPVSDDGEELEFLVAFGSGGGGVDEEDLRLVGVEEDLAVELEDAEPGVLNAFAVTLAAHVDLVCTSQAGELTALLQ